VDGLPLQQERSDYRRWDWKWCHPVPFPFLDTRSSNFTKGHVANQIQSIEKPENGSWEEKIQTRS
jgi:hypothetical protein